jgi:hypothetical protein
MALTRGHRPYKPIGDRFGPFAHLITALEEAEIIPGKHFDTRIKPLPLTNGNGRYMTVTPERALVSVGKCPLDI